MSAIDLKNRIMDLARPLVAARGLEIWGLELVDGPRLIARLFVDTPANSENRGAGATISQCEEISRELELAMDVEDLIDRSWILEVSSPGFERVFFNPSQLRPYIGDIVDVRLYEGLKDSPAPSRKNWRGILLGVNGDSLDIKPCSLSPEGDILPEDIDACRIPWKSARKVNRTHIFTTPRKPGKRKA